MSISRKQIQDALKNPAKFKLTFDSLFALRAAGKKYPDQAMPIMNYLVDHNEDFDRMIDDRAALVYLSEEFPDLAKILIQFVLTHPEEFNRLMHDKDDLKACAKSAAFKGYAGIFAAQNLAEAQKAIKLLISNKQILSVMATLFIMQNKNDVDSPFAHLPAEVLFRIAAHCSDSDVQSMENAKKSISEFYYRSP